ncbi:NAD binding domain of 6-phosphogluconate dehydrogenase family protein, partial [Vibrio parahaemolyticus V-223/04]
TTPSYLSLVCNALFIRKRRWA